jgi:hypothetical protein
MQNCTPPSSQAGFWWQVCARGGRSAVVAMMEAFRADQSLPIYAANNLTCYVIHEKPDTVRTTAYKPDTVRAPLSISLA